MSSYNDMDLEDRLRAELAREMERAEVAIESLNEARNEIETLRKRVAELEAAGKRLGDAAITGILDGNDTLARAEARITEFFEARLQRQYAILLEHKSRAEKAEAELDISREAHRMVQSALLSQAAETERAEVERDALRDALERITHCQYGPNTAPLMNIARAALAPSPAAKAVCNE